MSYEIEEFARALKSARVAKGLSQRELSRKADLPQGQISRIENGAVDLRLSSLITLARVLGLEPTLVPRKAVPAVKSIIRSSEKPALGSGESRRVQKELRRLQDTITKVSELQPKVSELKHLQRQVQTLQRFQGFIPDTKPIAQARTTVLEFKKNTRNLNALREAIAQMQNLRSITVHSPAAGSDEEKPRPAYSLDGDDLG